MAKFWRAIRNVIQNIPIPGVGVTINQVKEVAQTIKNDPGGVIIYQPPTQSVTAGGAALSGLEVKEKISPIFLAALGLGTFWALK